MVAGGGTPLETLFVELVAKVDNIEAKVNQALKAGERAAASGEKAINANLAKIGTGNAAAGLSQVEGRVRQASRTIVSQADQAAAQANAKLSTIGTGDVFKGSLLGSMAGNLITQLGQAFGQAGSAVFGFSSQLEQANIAFSTMLGSAEQGKAAIAALQQFAETTPFEFPQVLQLSQQLLGMGENIKNLIPDMTMLGDIAAGVGTSRLPFLTLAFSQVQAKTKLTGEELRQFAENGVPILDVLAKQMGKTTGEIMKMSENGQISFEDMRKGLQSLTAEGGMFFNLMEKQSHTFAGAMSNIKDITLRVAADMFEPIFNGMRDFANNAVKFLQSDDFKRWANDMKNVFATVGDALGMLVSFFDSIGLFEPLKAAFGVLIFAISHLKDAIADAIMAGTVLVVGYHEVKGQIERLIMEMVANVLETMAAWADAMSQGIAQSAHDWLVPIVSFVSEALKAFATLARGAAGVFGALPVFGEAVAGALNGAADAADGLAGSVSAIPDAVSGAIRGSGDSFRAAAGSIKASSQGVYDAEHQLAIGAAEAGQALVDKLNKPAEKTAALLGDDKGGGGGKPGVAGGAKKASDALKELGMSVKTMREILDLLGYSSEDITSMLVSIGVNAYDARLAFEALSVEAEKLAKFLTMLGYSGQRLTDAMDLIAQKLADKKAAEDAEKAAEKAHEAAQKLHDDMVKAAEDAEAYRKKLYDLASTIMDRVAPALELITNNLFGGLSRGVGTAAVAALQELVNAGKKAGFAFGDAMRGTLPPALAPFVKGSISGEAGPGGAPTPTGHAPAAPNFDVGGNGITTAQGYGVPEPGNRVEGSLPDDVKHAITIYWQTIERLLPGLDNLANKFDDLKGTAKGAIDAISAAFKILASAPESGLGLLHNALDQFEQQLGLLPANVAGPLGEIAAPAITGFRELEATIRKQIADGVLSSEEGMAIIAKAGEALRGTLSTLAPEIDKLRQTWADLNKEAQKLGVTLDGYGLEAAQNNLKRHQDDAKKLIEEAAAVAKSAWDQAFAHDENGFGVHEVVSVWNDQLKTWEMKYANSKERLEAWQRVQFGDTFDNMRRDAAIAGAQEVQARADAAARQVQREQNNAVARSVDIQRQAARILGITQLQGFGDLAYATVNEQFDAALGNKDQFTQGLFNMLVQGLTVQMDGQKVGRITGGHNDRSSSMLGDFGGFGAAVF